MPEFHYAASDASVHMVRDELTDMVSGYIEAAMLCNEDIEPDLSFAFTAVTRAYHECSRFLHDNYDAVWRARGMGETFVQTGRDLWLTRNGHGAGFWDRNLGALGDRLTEAAKQLGEQDAYLGDDGFIYLT
jgi:hypothetical protein